MRRLYDFPQSVEISESRWDVRITIIDSDGIPHTYIASADSALTDHDGIYFGTMDEYEEASNL